jgi:ankyrin repeat protein
MKHLVEYLLKNDKAAITKVTKQGQNALHWAALAGQADVCDDMVSFVEANPTGDPAIDKIIESIDSTGASPLLCACKSGGDPDTILRLIKHKGMIEQPDNEGWSPLRWAARYGRVDAAQVLLDAKCDPMSSDRKAKTALHWAAAAGHEEMCKLLLDYKASINAMTREHKRGPLHGAAQNGHAATVGLLISHPDCDVKAQDFEGGTAFFHRLLPRTRPLAACLP